MLELLFERRLIVCNQGKGLVSGSLGFYKDAINSTTGPAALIQGAGFKTAPINDDLAGRTQIAT